MAWLSGWVRAGGGNGRHLTQRERERGGTWREGGQMREEVAIRMQKSGVLTPLAVAAVVGPCRRRCLGWRPVAAAAGSWAWRASCRTPSTAPPPRPARLAAPCSGSSAQRGRSRPARWRRRSWRRQLLGRGVRIAQQAVTSCPRSRPSLRCSTWQLTARPPRRPVGGQVIFGTLCGLQGAVRWVDSRAYGGRARRAAVTLHNNAAPLTHCRPAAAGAARRTSGT